MKGKQNRWDTLNVAYQRTPLTKIQRSIRDENRPTPEQGSTEKQDGLVDESNLAERADMEHRISGVLMGCFQREDESKS